MWRTVSAAWRSVSYGRSRGHARDDHVRGNNIQTADHGSERLAVKEASAFGALVAGEARAWRSAHRARLAGRCPALAAVDAQRERCSVGGGGDGASFARKLIETGVPSAIGMARSVTPVVSAEFCHVLYQEICKGKPIADAYGSAVVALRDLPTYDECLWSVPMLYGSDNVIPLPTDDYVRFLSNVRQAARRMQELQRNLARLSLQAGESSGKWNVDSTRTAMGLGKVQSGLRYLRDNATATRAESYLWRLQFDISYRDLERRLAEVRDCMTELNQARGPTALFRGSQRFKSAAPRLISELDNIRRLVFDEFPAVAPS